MRTSLSSATDPSGTLWPSCWHSSSAPSSSSSVDPSPTHCPEPCTSTTRSVASSNRAGSALNCTPSASRQTSTSGAMVPGRRCCASVVPGSGPRAGQPLRCSISPLSKRCSTGERASFQSIDLRRGIEVVAIEQCDDSVVVRGSDGSRVRARYLVGCDGAHSTVRSLTGLTVHDLGFFYDWLIVDVVLEEPRDLRSDQHPDLRSDPAHHRRIGWPGATALGVHAPAA